MSAVPFRCRWSLPLRLPVSVMGVQGVGATVTIISKKHAGTVRAHTQHALHRVCHPSLQRPPSPPLHSSPSHHTKTACLGSLGNRPRFARRSRHSGPPVCRLPFRYGRGQRLPLLTTSLRYIPVCILQPTEPVPPTVCVLEAASGGQPSDEVPLMYGGATFEIKRCSTFSPSGIYNRCSCCSSAVNPP